MPDSLHCADAKDVILALAARHGITYQPRDHDALAHHITRLAGDDVVFDEIELLLVALQRAGHISRTDAVLLQADYLRQMKS